MPNTDVTNGSNWSNHPIVVVLGTLAAVATILTFYFQYMRGDPDKGLRASILGDWYGTSTSAPILERPDVHLEDHYRFTWNEGGTFLWQSRQRWTLGPGMEMACLGVTGGDWTLSNGILTMKFGGAKNSFEEFRANGKTFPADIALTRYNASCPDLSALPAGFPADISIVSVSEGSMRVGFPNKTGGRDEETLLRTPQ